MTRNELEKGLQEMVAGLMDLYDKGFTSVTIHRRRSSIDVTKPEDSFVMREPGPTQTVELMFHNPTELRPESWE